MLGELGFRTTKHSCTPASSKPKAKRVTLKKKNRRGVGEAKQATFFFIIFGF